MKFHFQQCTIRCCQCRITSFVVSGLLVFCFSLRNSHGFKVCCRIHTTCTPNQNQELRNHETGDPVLMSQPDYIYPQTPFLGWHHTPPEVKFHISKCLEQKKEKLTLKNFFYFLIKTPSRLN